MDRARAAVRAVEAHDWHQAVATFEVADTAGEHLSGANLLDWGMATYWTRDLDGAIDVLERAVAQYRLEGDQPNEARAWQALLQIASVAGRDAIMATGSARLRQLLDESPEGESHAIYQWAVARLVSLTDFDEAARLFEDALVTAQRVGSVTAESLALMSLSQTDTVYGRIEEARRKVDAAAALALSADVPHLVAGGVLCGIVWSCRNVGDWDRAAEWTEVATRWAERTRVSYYPGLCSFHRCEILRIRGKLEEAEDQAERACNEFAAVMAADTSMGFGYRELGRIRLLRGDHDGAREAFRLSAEYGVDPNPGLALLRLRHGEVASARRALEEALDAPLSGFEVPFLLPALVTACVADDDLVAAEHALDQLREISDDVGTDAHAAATAQAAAEVAFAKNDLDAARRHARDATRRWNAVGAPYEAAQAREVLAAIALRRLDAEDARFEFETVESIYRRVGASHDADRVARCRADMVEDFESSTDLADGPTPIDRAFMFTDIVGSTLLQSALGDERWITLLDWHDAMLTSTLEGHGGQIVKHEGDGFFVSFPTGRAALRAACEVQTQLDAHRRSSGFALDVRIGVHQGAAFSREGDWIGLAVTTSARVAASAEAGEVVCTAEVARAVPEAALTATRTITAKGIDQPLTVHTVERCG
jgi:class 3 adenylate cyclase